MRTTRHLLLAAAALGGYSSGETPAGAGPRPPSGAAMAARLDPAARHAKTRAYRIVKRAAAPEPLTLPRFDLLARAPSGG